MLFDSSCSAAGALEAGAAGPVTTSGSSFLLAAAVATWRQAAQVVHVPALNTDSPVDKITFFTTVKKTAPACMLAFHQHICTAGDESGSLAA